MFKKFLGCFMLGITILCMLNSGPAVASEKKTIRVITDPRIELMNVVQLMTGYWPMCRFDIEYMNEAYEQFGPYWEHPVLRQYAMMWFMHGFSQEIPHALMLHLSDPPELQIKTSIPKYIIDKAGGDKKLNDFLELLRDFAKKTRFMDFYDSHREFYRKHITIVSEFISDKEYIQRLEDFFGPNRYSYSIILSPLVYEDGYGINVSSQLYSIIGPSDGIEKQPIFDNPQALSKQIYHDFSQSFINPLSSRNRESILRQSKLFQPIWREMMNQGYHSWEPSFNEHLIRSAMIWIYQEENGLEEAIKYLNDTYMRGFIYTDFLYDLMLEYSQNRDLYPTYADYYPRILEAMSYICELPYSPTYLTINYASVHGVQLEWMDNSLDEDGFVVYRRKNKKGNFQAISSTLPPNQSWYRDEDILPGDILEYKVAAKNHKGEIFSNKTYLILHPETPLSPRKISYLYNEEEGKLIISWEYNFKVDGFILYDLTTERKEVMKLANDARSCEVHIEKQVLYRFTLTAFQQITDDNIIESLDSPIIRVIIP